MLITSNLIGCDKQNEIREKLDYVNRMTEVNPQSALISLDSLQCRDMSEGDKKYFDFLCIKGRDKAFIPHTADSLYLSVLDYYSNNQDDEMYAEVLYYGGRVYFDLGDFTKALSYFHNALDAQYEAKNNLNLRASMLSQTGHLLSILHLYDEAIPYVREAIKIDSLLNDHNLIVYDMQLLGSILLNSEQHELAESTFKTALTIASKDSMPDEVGSLNTFIAASKYYKDELDSALNLIRDARLKLDSTYYHDLALSYACLIYHTSNISDTTILYAQELINKPDLLNRRLGFETILSPDIRGLIHPDSAMSYAYNSMVEGEAYLNKVGEEKVLLNNSFYNYQQQQKKLVKVNNRNVLLIFGIVGASLIAIISCFYAMYMRYSNKSRMLQLREALEIIKKLREELYQVSKCHIAQDADKTDTTVERIDINYDQKIDNKDNNIHEAEVCPDNFINSNSSISKGQVSVRSLQEKFRNELMELLQDFNLANYVSPLALEPKIYCIIMQYIKEEKVISDCNPLWNDIENVILKSSPDFKYRLNILAAENLKKSDFNIVLLIKCGITPSNISTLIGRSKGTVTYRRRTIGLKVLGRDVDLGTIDNIIKLL